MGRCARVTIVAAAAALSVVACGSSIGATIPTATFHTLSAQPTLTSPTASPRSAPSGFQPVALSAISESVFWVLGSVGCEGESACQAVILRTLDAGRTFQRTPAPRMVYLDGTGTGERLLVNEVRFADASDGWVFGQFGPMWSTHDGGAH